MTLMHARTSSTRTIERLMSHPTEAPDGTCLSSTHPGWRPSSIRSTCPSSRSSRACVRRTTRAPDEPAARDNAYWGPGSGRQDRTGGRLRRPAAALWSSASGVSSAAGQAARTSRHQAPPQPTGFRPASALPGFVPGAPSLLLRRPSLSAVRHLVLGRVPETAAPASVPRSPGYPAVAGQVGWYQSLPINLCLSIGSGGELALRPPFHRRRAWRPVTGSSSSSPPASEASLGSSSASGSVLGSFPPPGPWRAVAFRNRPIDRATCAAQYTSLSAVLHFSTGEGPIRAVNATDEANSARTTAPARPGRWVSIAARSLTTCWAVGKGRPSRRPSIPARVSAARRTEAISEPGAKSLVVDRHGIGTLLEG